MTKGQEAQQAQTIKRIELEIKLGRATMINDGEAKMKANVVSLLEIVDSQAQKIAKQEEIIKALRSVHDMKSEIEEVQKRIRETL